MEPGKADPHVVSFLGIVSRKRAQTRHHKKKLNQPPPTKTTQLGWPTLNQPTSLGSSQDLSPKNQIWKEKVKEKEIKKQKEKKQKTKKKQLKTKTTKTQSEHSRWDEKTKKMKKKKWGACVCGRSGRSLGDLWSPIWGFPRGQDLGEPSLDNIPPRLLSGWKAKFSDTTWLHSSTRERHKRNNKTKKEEEEKESRNVTT